MTIRVNDQQLVAELAAKKTPQVLMSADGTVLGRYFPLEEKMSCPESGMTDRELLELANEKEGWVSAAEVEETLRRLTKAQ